MFSFSEKAVLITGASSGIGAALTRAFHEKGAHLILLARRLDRLNQLKEELRSPNRQILIYECDVNDETALRKVVDDSSQKLGHIDVVIANAGFGIVGDVADLSVEDYKRQLETNVFGVIRTFHSTVNHLKKSRGRFAAVGSVNGYIALPGNSAYAMSKYAVRALCKSLRHEMRPFGVSVIHIAPGFVDSEIRRVDNSGKFRPNSKDKIPAWITMPASTAARKILRAIYCRRAERIVTAHGYWAVFVERHFPWAFSLLLCLTGLKARPEP